MSRTKSPNQLPYRTHAPCRRGGVAPSLSIVIFLPGGVLEDSAVAPSPPAARRLAKLAAAPSVVHVARPLIFISLPLRRLRRLASMSCPTRERSACNAESSFMKSTWPAMKSSIHLYTLAVFLSLSFLSDLIWNFAILRIQNNNKSTNQSSRARAPQRSTSLLLLRSTR